MTAEPRQNADTTRTQRISDKFVKALEPPDKPNRIYYDTEVKGFGIRITRAGKKAFVLNYYSKGRERRITIGPYPEWSVTAARMRASELRRSVDAGNDPLEDREKDRAAPTVFQMFERYDRDHVPKLSDMGQRDVRRYFKEWILPRIGSKKVADVTFSDCEAIHRKASERAPTSANRAMAYLRRALNLAITWGWIDRNPIKGLEFNQERKRERYLNADEIDRLLRALDGHPRKDSVDAIKLMLFTGCRRGEALGATWDQFDDDLRIWTKPASTTKQRRLHRVPVSKPVTALLKKRLKARGKKKIAHVFPSRNGEALKEVRRTWSGVQKTANLQGIRLHDLRHTFASVAVSQGQSLPVIGAMLGHSQTQTTARYAHLCDDPLIQATEQVAKAIKRRPKKR